MNVEQAEPADLLAAMPTKEFDQAMGGGDVSPDGVRAAAPVIGKVIGPTRRDCARRMPIPL